MKKVLIAVTVLFTAVSAHAQADLELISNESAMASKSADLDSAYNLASKSIDGSLKTGEAPAVYMEIAPAKQENIEFSAAVEKETAEVPVPETSKKDKGYDGDHPGFLKTMGGALAAPVISPVAGLMAGGLLGQEFLKEYHVKNKVALGAGAAVGGLTGLIAGIIASPFVLVGGVVFSFVELAKGRI